MKATMPLIETVSLLTALANAYQVLRPSRPAGEFAAAQPDAGDEAAVVFAYDLARTSYESALQRIETANRHMTLLAAGTALVTLASVLAVKAIDSDAGLESAFLWAALILTLVAGVSVVLVRIAASPKLMSTRALLGKQPAGAPLQLMEDYVRIAASCTEHNDVTLKVRSFGGEILLLCSAVNALLLALWALSV